ncbi:MAG: excinuclease ABC subunit UvrA [Flavobacteriales bacterium]|nr:excinuclease ABC subunit UvrA [Flavobacteriales bacterium]
MSKRNITIRGARLHNLKNIDLELPHRKLIVITGLSGSGKSTLAFDTLYAEGQRRYIESLSAYARQFLGKIDKPEVDSIMGIAPAIAISQKVRSSNPRSTVGTTTEIYDYLKLLFARIGQTFSPVSGQVVNRHTPESIAQQILSHPEGTRAMVFAPYGNMPKSALEQRIEILKHQGYTRVMLNGKVVRLDEADALIEKQNDLSVLIDRFAIDTTEEMVNRTNEAVRVGLGEGRGSCFVKLEFPEGKNGKWKMENGGGDAQVPVGIINHQSSIINFSTEFAADGLTFEEPSVNLFSFNNPYGACKKCEGFGSVIGIDPDLVIPNKGMSVYEGAVACWQGETMGKYRSNLVRVSLMNGFPIHRAVHELTEEQLQLLWNGDENFEGILDFFKMLEENSYKIQYRVMLSRYRGKTTCPDCRGTKLRNDANYVKVGGKSISDLVLMPISELAGFFGELELTDTEREIAKRLLREINTRISYLQDVGLGYLMLNRESNTLSGGESQRIHLAGSLGSSLVGSMYILDEPSIGLHPRDTERLIGILKKLRDLGNTVIVVEHDEDIMRAADLIVDIGPEAGVHGGEVVFRGTQQELVTSGKSLTAKYLTGKLEIPVPKKRRPARGEIKVVGARQHDLKNITVGFPLKCMTVITGVSGSGKTTLMQEILYPALKRHYGGFGLRMGQHDRIEGNLDRITDVEFVDQNPIGRSTRSNPVTYIKAYDDIRNLFADHKMSKLRGYQPRHFSFNVAGGRCEVCEGEGTVKIEMQFMADIIMKCESCDGKRFKEEVLEIRYEDRDINDILCMTVDEAMEFFTAHMPRIAAKVKPLQDVGLGYVQLGQSSSTLSGGEAQRIKLASFLGKAGSVTNKPTLFIFDEPTTGLHFHDIHRLLGAFNALLDQGHSIILVEHHPDIIKCADHVIDLGPEGGKGGGNVVFEGTPEELVKCEASLTGRAMRGKV